MESSDRFVLRLTRKESELHKRERVERIDLGEDRDRAMRDSKAIAEQWFRLEAERPFTDSDPAEQSWYSSWTGSEVRAEVFAVRSSELEHLGVLAGQFARGTNPEEDDGQS